MSMNNILEQLVDTDKRARELVDNADEELELAVANIDREIDEFKKSYSERAKHRIGIVRDTESKASQEATGDISHRYEALMQNLETVYEDKHSGWEDELFARCVGR
ncbi:MAG: hypothetical protein RRY54_06840 [Angelakisella sp.]